MTPRLAPLAVFLVIASVSTAVSAQSPNPVNLWSVELHWRGDRLLAGEPEKLTHNDGTNSQPSFTPDGRAIVFSALRDTGSNARSDIYRLDLRTRRETRVTRTPENENSPTVDAAGNYTAVRWVPATLFRQYGPWVYAPDGTPLRGVLPGPDTTGYYTPLAGGLYALTRPKSKGFTLALFDPRAGTITDVDSGVPALPSQRIPGVRALSYVRVDTANGRHEIRRIDLATRRITTIFPAVRGRTVHAWIPGHNMILMARGNVLYARRPVGDKAWRSVATFANPEIRNAAAYVVSPAGDRLILTSAVRLPLVVVVRDSLEAGRSAHDIAAMVIGWKDAGRLGEYDLVEAPLLALGDDRMHRKQTADAVVLHSLATNLFPKSHAAFARLGDAERSAGDTAAAIAAYRTALELNPRLTEADRKAAEAVELKLKPPI